MYNRTYAAWAYVGATHLGIAPTNRYLYSQCVSPVQKRAWRDSNPRPSGPEPDALSTELHALN